MRTQIRYIPTGDYVRFRIKDTSVFPVITSSVDAVLGRSATLPCDIEPGIREDRVYMVLWYRDTNSKPIYRYDWYLSTS
ncbi:hypothetical protein GEV33_005198 [Tenebrio molitor]|uniref:Uncharacterized protein n=1 Tax=Tenebrio molitor TaxID=7067 RepID=A0A8J6HQ32_TENMO|nr:hypothetical protein GEV33_005198 [Tenebrio molitor]